MSEFQQVCNILSCRMVLFIGHYNLGDLFSVKTTPTLFRSPLLELTENVDTPTPPKLETVETQRLFKPVIPGTLI